MPVPLGGPADEPLTLVNPEGVWVGSGSPALEDAELRRMYRAMVAIQPP